MTAVIGKKVTGPGTTSGDVQEGSRRCSHTREAWTPKVMPRKDSLAKHLRRKIEKSIEKRQSTVTENNLKEVIKETEEDMKNKDGEEGVRTHKVDTPTQRPSPSARAAHTLRSSRPITSMGHSRSSPTSLVSSKLTTRAITAAPGKRVSHFFFYPRPLLAETRLRKLERSPLVYG